jgi:hypothetical protein
LTLLARKHIGLSYAYQPANVASESWDQNESENDILWEKQPVVIKVTDTNLPQTPKG